MSGGGVGHRPAAASSVASSYRFNDIRLRRKHPTKKDQYTTARYHSCNKCTAHATREATYKAGHYVEVVVQAGSAVTSSVHIHTQTCPHASADENRLRRVSWHGSLRMRRRSSHDPPR